MTSRVVPHNPVPLHPYALAVIALREVPQFRIGITDHLTEMVLNQALAWFDRGRRGDARLAIERCHSHRRQCRPIMEGATGRVLCRCRGNTPHASAWNGRLPWHNAAERTPLAA